MAETNVLIEDNIGYLQQGLDLIASLDDRAYAEPAAVYPGSGIGSHFRHCTDHYERFLAGLAGGRVDYDQRDRNPAIESDRNVAMNTIRTIIGQLEAAAGEDKPLDVKMDCGDESDEAGWWSRSSARRELQFLVSHTVHHYALIVMMLKARGIDAGPDFGVAPSTLRYRKTGASCAQ